MKNETVRLHIPNLDKALHAQIKSAAALEGMALKDWVPMVLQKYLDSQNSNSAPAKGD